MDYDQPTKIGVLFDSDTLKIPDDISDLIANIFGNVLSRTNSVDIVTPAHLETIGYNLGFNKSQFSTVDNAAAIGQQAELQYMLLTSMNFDTETLAKAQARKGIAKILGGKKKVSLDDIKPTLDVKIIDVASKSVILDTEKEIDAFKDDMKRKIIAGKLDKIGLTDLDTSAISEFAMFLAPEMQSAINKGTDVIDDLKIASVVEPVKIASEDNTSFDSPVVVSETKRSTVSKIFVSEAHAAPTSSPSSSTNSILVNQPAYHNMNFHVYKPADVPGEYYVTYDGYLVYKADRGIWYYASNNSTGIMKTSYVVGSVIPSVVKLRPYDKNRASVAPIRASAIEERSNRGKISIPMNSTTTVTREVTRVETPTRQEITITMNPTATPQYIPPSTGTEIYNPVVLNPNAAEWTKNSTFMAISKWQKSIDQIGVLDRPKTPVAWKGDFPEVIYVWTGQQWRQISANGRPLPAISLLRRESYALMMHVRKVQMLRWSDSDSNVLAQYSRLWGYKWLGNITTGREY